MLDWRRGFLTSSGRQDLRAELEPKHAVANSCCHLVNTIEDLGGQQFRVSPGYFVACFLLQSSSQVYLQMCGRLCTCLHAFCQLHLTRRLCVWACPFVCKVTQEKLCIARMLSCLSFARTTKNIDSACFDVFVAIVLCSQNAIDKLQRKSSEERSKIQIDVMDYSMRNGLIVVDSSLDYSRHIDTKKTFSEKLKMQSTHCILTTSY